jgi:hypothetical protein
MPNWLDIEQPVMPLAREDGVRMPVPLIFSVER